MSKNLIRKTFSVQRKTIDAAAGIYEAMISTEQVDRDGDIIRAAGVDLTNFYSNPVVIAGHDYRNLESVIGKALEITVVPGEGLRAKFQFASADVNPKAEMVRRLWDAEFLNATSIGFIPKAAKPMQNGGMDFEKSELLEFSIVGIPSNQAALAIRSMAKSIGMSDADLMVYLAEDESAAARGKESDASVTGMQGDNLAWIRRLTVESNLGVQTVFACFRQYTINVPKDAEKLMSDKENGIYSAPHPHAGKTLLQKEVTFVPPIEFDDADWGKDAAFQRSSAGESDDEMVKAHGDEWDIKDFSEVLLALPLTKSFRGRAPLAMDVCELKLHDVARVKAIVSKRAAQKRGRVLSAKNEATLRGAQEDLNSAKDKLDGVLAQLDEAPNADDSKDDQKEVGSAVPSPDATEKTAPPMPPSLPAEVATGLSVELRQLVNAVKTVFA